MKGTADALLHEETLAFFYKSQAIVGEPLVVKSGKEATVYRCEGHPSTGLEYVAVKFYRPRRSRGFKNDAAYREGRDLGDERAIRAAAKKTKFGREVEFASWIGQEFETMRMLHRAGCDVPKPVSYSDHVILMEFIGDGPVPGMPLHAVNLDPGEAKTVFHRLLWNIETMLQHHRVHGDLSAYNILYAAGRATIIDFPQAVDPRTNRHAADMLARDVQNVCRYFADYGVRWDGERFTDDLWARYQRERRYSFN